MKNTKTIKKRIISMLLSLIFITGAVQMPVYSVDEEAQMSELVQNETVGEETDSDLLQEDVSLRGKFSKHYVSPNGSRYMVVFPEQVHYEENGSWIEIDNSFTLDAVSREYVSANEKFSTRFSQNAKSDRLVSVDDGEYSLSWSITFNKQSSGELAERSMISETEISDVRAVTEAYNTAALGRTRAKENISDIGKAVSGISYNNIFGAGVDLRYSVSHGRVEEDVIMSSADDLVSYTMAVSTGGLTAIKNDDGSVDFVADDGARIFNIDAPWMSDAVGAVSHAVSVSVIQRGDKAFITYTPDAEWLKDTARTYPVLIDPTVTTREYQSNYVDTYVSSSDTSATDHSDESILKVGTNGSSIAYMKILNFPDFDYVTEIEAATLEFSAGYKSLIPNLDIYEIAEEWTTNSISYNNQPYAALIIGAQNGTKVGQHIRYSIDIEEWVSEKVSQNGGFLSSYFNGYDWNGFKIRYSSSQSENTANEIDIISSESAMSAFRPTMTIQYRYETVEGIEDEAVYCFENYGSGSYLTVCGGNTVDYTNVIQQEEISNSLSQAFRLDYNYSHDCYSIRAMCSSDGYGSILRIADINDTINDLGYDGGTCGNVYLEQEPVVDPDSGDDTYYDEYEWLIYPCGEDLYKIVMRADPRLALTVCGEGDGTANGKTDNSEGNVFVSEFTGASEQLWNISSGGSSVLYGHNIKNYYDGGGNFEISDNATTIAFCCPVTNFGDTVIWQSSKPNVATVDSSGNVTKQGVGYVTICATVTDADGGTTEYECSVYVCLTNGVYYFINEADHHYRLGHEDSITIEENMPLKVYQSSSTVPDNRGQMFKITHIEGDKYSIRSMLDSRMGWTWTSSGLVMTTIGTSDSSLTTNQKWLIDSNQNGVYIYLSKTQKPTVTAPSQSGENIVFSGYSSSDLNQCWSIYKLEIDEDDSNHHEIEFINSTTAVKIGDSHTFSAMLRYSAVPGENGHRNIRWSVTNGTGSATIDSNTGVLTATGAGQITVTAWYGSTGWEESIIVTLYRTAVVLIHGRTSNSFIVWGANNGVWVNQNKTNERANNHYNSSFLAKPIGVNTAYTEWETQMIVPFGSNGTGIFNDKYPEEEGGTYSYPHPEGGNLAQYLVNNGYTPNVDLFVFNYPNEDAVVYNALKLEGYLDDLAMHVYNDGTLQQKLSLFGNANPSNANSYVINIVAHSMGGLVARYYIENQNRHVNVEKLITIGTPHWGSNFADLSSGLGISHALSDHDLMPNSFMFGGSNSITLDCDLIIEKCCSSSYQLTNTIDYTSSRSTEYYAIAGIAHEVASGTVFTDDFEIRTNFYSTTEIQSIVQENLGNNLSISDIAEEDDNLVGFLSQIGFTDNTYIKKVQMKKIHVFVDTYFYNAIWSSYHSKLPHRDDAMDKILEYLND